MEDILEQVKLYDIKTLRQTLLDNGIKVGPIAPSSANIFQKRLAKHLFLKQGGKLDDDDTNPQSQAPISHVSENISQKQENATNFMADVYYAVCFPEELVSFDIPDGEN